MFLLKKEFFILMEPSNSYELIEWIKKLTLMNKKKDYEEFTAVSYSNELKPEILEIHKKYNVTVPIKK